MTINAPMRIFLVLLQLAIGWHFVFEAVAKFKKGDWTGKHYLAAAPGPGGPILRALADAPDQPPEPSIEEQDADLLARYTLKPIDANADRSMLKWHEYLSDPLARDWDATYEKFVDYYGLPEGKGQANAGQVRDEVALLGGHPWTLLLAQAPAEVDPVTPAAQRVQTDQSFVESKNALARWLHGPADPQRDRFAHEKNTRELYEKVNRPKVSGPAGAFELTTPQRVREYVKIRDTYQAKLAEAGIFGDRSPELQRLKAARDTLRAQLVADLDQRKQMMEESLREKLTYEQRRMPTPREAEAAAAKAKAAEAGKKKAAAPGTWRRVAYTDAIVKWGLLIAGCGLILGLLTRTSCVIGILLLFTFYITWPPFPGVPVPPNAEGNYFLINKNLIEMLALFVLAFSYPAERYGFDGLIRLLWARPEDERPVITNAPARVEVKTVEQASVEETTSPDNEAVADSQKEETPQATSTESSSDEKSSDEPSSSERSDASHGS